MEVNIESLVKNIVEKLNTETDRVANNETQSANKAVNKPKSNLRYPLGKNHTELLKSKSGKAFSDITFDGLIQGKVTHNDFKTSPETLLMQAEIAEKVGKVQFANNLRRAAELTNVPDEEVLRIYDKLRPNRATKVELLDIAKNLRDKYNANKTADLIEETASIYEKRNILI